MDNSHKILLVIAILSWMIVLTPFVRYKLKRKRIKKRRIKEFDKLCENTLTLIHDIHKPFIELKERVVYFNHKLYQQNIRFKTNFE